MSSEIPKSPPRKKYKQTTIMDSLYGASVSKQNKQLDTTESSWKETVSVVSSSFKNVETSADETLVSYKFELCSIIQSKHMQRSCWNGKPLEEMRNLFNHTPVELVKVEPSPTHTVLVKQEKGKKQKNHGSSVIYKDIWDSQHIRMPCSPCSQCPVHEEGKSRIEERWIVIGKAFSQKIKSSLELEKAIFSYNSQYSHIWDFQELHKFINNVMSGDERAKFFNFTLPGIIQLALQLPEKLPQPPILLVAQKQQSLSMTQSQIASLLANAFLCTYPRRNTQKKNSEFSNYPVINFAKMFENKTKAPHVQGKLRCIIHYFNRVLEKEPKGVVTFTRKVVSYANFPNWGEKAMPLLGLHVSSEGTIEKEGTGFLQMDFADRFIGGGVLSFGCVQEEIRFVTCPELIAACLFCEVMDDNEALIITGCEQYCKQSGYSRSFMFEGDFQDETPLDQYGRRLCQVVAIDATRYRRTELQYQREDFTRELNKAFVGFCNDQGSSALTAVATGNWGCGVFHGDPRLKGLLQLMAASVAGRDIIYFTFGDQRLRDDLFNMYSLLKEKNVSVGKLYQLLGKYGDQFKGSSFPNLDLYGYLFATLDAL